MKNNDFPILSIASLEQLKDNELSFKQLLPTVFNFSNINTIIEESLDIIPNKDNKSLKKSILSLLYDSVDIHEEFKEVEHNVSYLRVNYQKKVKEIQEYIKDIEHSIQDSQFFYVKNMDYLNEIKKFCNNAVNESSKKIYFQEQLTPLLNHNKEIIKKQIDELSHKSFLIRQHQDNYKKLISQINTSYFVLSEAFEKLLRSEEKVGFKKPKGNNCITKLANIAYPEVSQEKEKKQFIDFLNTIVDRVKLLKSSTITQKISYNRNYNKQSQDKVYKNIL